MSLLSIYDLNTLKDNNAIQPCKRFTDYPDIKNYLESLNVQFERWVTHDELADHADQDTIIAAYEAEIKQLIEVYKFQSIDVIQVKPDHIDKQALRQKFLSEHVHDDFEVRFFIEGRGLFYLHVDDKVYSVLCEKGDLISVPSNTPHWFDMGENPNFKTIRLFTTPYGWVANFTGSELAKQFPTLDQIVTELS